MALVSLEPSELKRLIRQRRRMDGCRYDEVWDGVYVMAPLADNEHQSLRLKFAIGFTDALDPVQTPQIFPGCNVSDQPERWKRNYRCPESFGSRPVANGWFNATLKNWPAKPQHA